MRFITFIFLIGFIGSTYADTIRCYFTGHQELSITGRVKSNSNGYYFISGLNGKSYTAPISACIVEYT